MAILIPRKKEFWQRKPTGRSEINWGHELLSRNQLQHCFVISNDAGNYLVDLTGRKDAVLTGGAEINGQVLDLPGGGSNSVATVGDDAWGDQSFTILSQGLLRSSANFPAMFGKGDTGTGEFMVRYASGSIEFYRGGVIGSIAQSLNERFYCAAYHDKNGAVNADRWRFYVDGARIGTGGAANATLSTKDLEIGNADSLIATNRRWAGEIDYNYVFFNPMTIDDIASLGEAPYQILKKKTSIFFMPEAGGAPTFEPVWARKTNTLIGGGLNV